MNFYSNSSEWKWLFHNAIDWKKIIPLYYPEFPNADGLTSQEEVIKLFEELIAQTGEWAATAVTHRSTQLDLHGPGHIENGRTIPNEHIQTLYKECIELGIFGLTVSSEHGGMNLPAALNLVITNQISQACLASSTQTAFFSSIADMLERFGPAQFKTKYIPQIVEGKISGSMCLTEPGSGSDLGAIKTVATLQNDGTYLLNGTKTFITNAGGGIAYVLARIKDEPEGLDGLSMFFLEQEIEKDGTTQLNYKITKNESKMGLHGSFTCEVVYENSTAHLVGEKNMGFKYMLHLMNEARLAVGVQALGTIEGALSYAKKYAQERIQFNHPLAELPLYARNLANYETELNALRALIMDTISWFEIYQKLDLKEKSGTKLSKDEQKLFKESAIWTRKRTPLIKYYACESATKLTQNAIQMLGGYGFMQEYPVERYHRDSFAALIYEGTSQIQALTALKDVVKYAVKDPKKFFAHIFLKHPIGSIINGTSECSKRFTRLHYNFKKRLISLLIHCLKPSIDKVFDPKAWIDMEKTNELMKHAETVCQALAYMETLRVLYYHADKDINRQDLFFKYERLITPRLEAIYKDWSLC